jgi:PPK2 family polyphosphate:nucleotide phosphotransferase
MATNYLIKPGEKIEIRKFDPEDISWWKKDKSTAKKEIKKLRKKLITLQQLLYAEKKQKILIVLQAMDSGGKDGTIQAIFKGVNPQGVSVANFKVPTPVEMGHDYLWRIHEKTPQNGEIVIFNRSHYEEVLIVRVHNLVPKKVWEKRYNHITQFEQLLADEGTTILKFFLNISKEEQKNRFIDRIDVPEKNWKFNPNDIEERKFWDDYMLAYGEAISRTSAIHAPWYIIPANHNWYRDLVIAKIITKTLENLKMSYPQPIENLESYKASLLAE